MFSLQSGGWVRCVGSQSWTLKEESVEGNEVDAQEQTHMRKECHTLKFQDKILQEERKKGVERQVPRNKYANTTEENVCEDT